MSRDLVLRSSNIALAGYLLIASSGCGPTGNIATDKGRREAINDVVKSAGAFPVVATQQPTPVGPPTTKSQLMQDGTTWQCTSQEFNASSNPDQYAIVNPLADVLYPGAVIAGSSLVSGGLNPVPLKRAGGTVTLAIASSGGNIGSYSRPVGEVSLSSITDAVNSILTAYTGPTPAKFDYEVSDVYSLNQLMFQLNADLKWAGPSVTGQLQFSTDKEYNRVMVKLQQEYFTMAFQAPYSPADFFDGEVTAAALSPYVGPGNPLTYLNSVTYGRTFVFLFESTTDQNTLHAAVSAVFNVGIAGVGVGVNAGLSADYRNVFQNTRAHVFALGGNATDALTGATGDVEQVLAFLRTGASFGPTQPGVPLSYAARYVSDATSVRVNLTSDYTEKQCAPVTDTQSLVLTTTSVQDRCSDGCTPWYWTFTAKVPDPSNPNSPKQFQWSTKERANALNACSSTTLTANNDSVVLTNVPRKEGSCIEISGNVREVTGSTDREIGAFADKTVCYSGGQWQNTGAKVASANDNVCGGTGAVVNYTVTVQP